MALSVGELLAYLRLDSTQFDKGIATARAGMTGAAESAGRLGGAVGMTEAAFANAGRQANVASAGTAKFKAAQLGVTAATEKYNAVLADENASIRQLALAEKGLITANERLRATTPIAPVGFKAAAGEMDTAAVASGRMGGAMASTLGMAKSLGLMLGAFEILKKGIDIGKEASSFQKQMTMIATNANAGTAEVKKMTPAVLALSGPLGTAPDQLAVALYHIEQNGLRGAKALDVLAISGKGAKVGNADLEATTNSMTAAVASGIPGVKNMDQAMGALIATVGTGDMKMSDLNEALGSGMLVKVKAYGLSLRDVGAALAVFGDNNVRGADAATMVVQAVQAMAKPAAGGKKALGDIGLSVDALAKDMQEGGLNKAILDLNDHLTTAGITGVKTGGFLLEAFGKKQAAGISVLLGQVDRLETKYAELDKGSASFGSKWEATTKTVSFAFDRIKANFEAAGISLANKLLPKVQVAVQWLGTDLPHALGILQATLAPTEHAIGVGLVVAWHAATIALGGAAIALGAIGHFLSEHKTLVTDIAVPVLAMWAAYKGYQIAVLAVTAVRTSLALMANSAALNLSVIRTWGAGISARFAGNATEAQLSAMIQKKAFLDIEEAAMADAVVQDRAAAMKAVAYADVVAASTSASDAEVASADRAAAAALAQARASQLAAGLTAAAAEEAGVAVAEAGDTAAIGWASMLGPLALVGVGVGALTMLFGHNGGAAHKNAQDIQTLTAAIQSDSDAIGVNTAQSVANTLSKSGALEAARQLGLNLSDVTQAALGNAPAIARISAAYDEFQTQVTAANDVLNTNANHGSPEYVKAYEAITDTLNRQGTAWDKLHESIDGSSSDVKAAVQNAKDLTAATAKSGSNVTWITTAVTKAAAATKAATSTAAVAAAQNAKDLRDAAGNIGWVVTAVNKAGAATKAQAVTAAVAAKTQAAAVASVATETAIAAGVDQQYAAMLGITVNELGKTGTASDLVAKSIQTMSYAYETATQSGSDFLSAMQSFSTLTDDTVTAADRAKLMGAALKAANGDALNLAGALAGTTSAVDAMADAFKNQSDQLATQSADQTKAITAVTKAHRGTETAAAKVTAAEARLAQVRSNSKATNAQIKSAEAALTAAQNTAKNSADSLATAQTNAGKAGALAASDTEFAAIKFTKTAKGWTAAIDTNAKGAGDLVSQMQGIQTAAMDAAGALYQSEVATKGAKQASDDAYNLYVSKTKGQFVDAKGHLTAQSKEMGLNVTEAKALATAYFGMPADVKTTIEAIGTDPVLTVLNKIGQLLATFTGQPWVTVMTAKDKATPVIDDLNTKLDFLTDRKAGPYITATDKATAILDGILTRMGKINGAQVIAKISETSDIHRAGGGEVFGPGGPTSDTISAKLSPHEFVENATATAKYRPILQAMNRGGPLPAFGGPAGKSADNPSVVKHQKITVIVQNPLPERASESVPHAIRRATNRLDR